MRHQPRLRRMLVAVFVVAGILVTASLAANSPPTSVHVPVNKAKLSGTTTLDATASKASRVQFWLLGGSFGYSGKMLCTATLNKFGWLCSWNTTTVPSGSYFLLSEAINSSGSNFSAYVNITVNNNPTTSVLIPVNKEKLSGTTTLDATASKASRVQFWLVGGSFGYSGKMLCTATPNKFGWQCSWNTTMVPSGSYVLLSEAFNSTGSSFSAGVRVTIP